MSEVAIEVRPSGVTQGDLAPKRALPESFNARAEEVGRAVADVADRIREHLAQALESGSSADFALDQIQLHFSIDLQAEAGVVIARTSASAAFQAQLTWKRSALR